MNYGYAAVWLAAGLFLIVWMGRQKREFYVAGGLFFLFGIGWLLLAIFPQVMETGWVRVLVKVVRTLMMVGMCLFFVYRKPVPFRPPDEESPPDGNPDEQDRIP